MIGLILIQYQLKLLFLIDLSPVSNCDDNENKLLPFNPINNPII